MVISVEKHKFFPPTPILNAPADSSVLFLFPLGWWSHQRWANGQNPQHSPGNRGQCTQRCLDMRLAWWKQVIRRVNISRVREEMRFERHWTALFYPGPAKLRILQSIWSVIISMISRAWRHCRPVQAPGC